MITHLKICEECATKLEQYGEIAYKLYVNICEAQANKQLVYTETGKFGRGPTIIRFLECRGFICSTEMSFEYLAVKATGYQFYEEEGAVIHEFCAFRDKHL